MVYRSKSGERVVFRGSSNPITTWCPVSDPKVIAKMNNDAAHHVMVAHLARQGLTDYGQPAPRGFGQGTPFENENFFVISERGFGATGGAPEAELFWNDQPMTLARWPNEGFCDIHGTDGEDRIRVRTKRLARWVSESDPWIMACWKHDWAELHERIVGIDPRRRVITRSADIKPSYGIDAKRARWYAYNLLSEIDRPGEYYIDRHSGLLYFWPPDRPGEATLSLADGFVKARDLSHVYFRHLRFQVCRESAIVLKGGKDCRVTGCTIGNTGRCAVLSSGGIGHAVNGCDVYDCGEGGIGLGGDGRFDLVPALHNVENNHIHHYSRRACTYKPAIGVQGVGCRIAHNLIHDGPGIAVSARGNDHVVEYNEIHNVVTNVSDAGAYYVGRDWSERGTEVRYNYWHQICSTEKPHGMTIYLDDQYSGLTIKGNLFEKCAHPVFIGGGSDNVVANNVFLHCSEAIHLDDRGTTWQKAATLDPNGTLQKRLRLTPFLGRRWQTRYPFLSYVLNADPGVPKRNVVRRNVCSGGVWLDFCGRVGRHQTILDNLVFDESCDHVQIEKDETGRPIRVKFQDEDQISALEIEPIPVWCMGVYESPDRASWPVEHAVRECPTLPTLTFWCRVSRLVSDLWMTWRYSAKW